MTNYKDEVDQQFAVIEKLWNSNIARLEGEIVALRESKAHDFAAFNLRFEDIRQHIAVALAAEKNAGATKDENLERRFQSIIDTQTMLNEQTSRFALRAEGEIAHDGFRREIDELRVKVTRTETHYESSEKNASIERTQLEQRLSSMNEFRAQLTDQATSFITRAEYDAGHKPLEDRLIEFSHPNYAVIGSFASLVVGLVAAMWLVIGLKIESISTPTVLAIEQIKSKELTHDQQLTNIIQDLKTMQLDYVAFAQARAVSQKDREQLNDRVKAQELAIEAGKTERMASFAEIRLELAKMSTLFNDHLQTNKVK